MCGIFGVVNKHENREVSRELFDKALATMQHRGPDNLSSFHSGIVSLGHLRLSIIDLNPSSNQPFTSPDSRYTLVYNGEIFNFQEIRQELEKNGVLFTTNSDTEVLLQAYINYGEDCVQHFNGMWAFAIFDAIKNELFCSRDRFGIKPLYYFEDDDEFIFASELKAILTYRPSLRKPNYNQIANYLRTSVGVQTGETWFERIQSVPPAHNVRHRKLSSQFYQYWNYPKQTNKNISFEKAAEKYRALFQDAIRLRLRSDVPIGITLSSGIDSSSIASVVSQLQPGAAMKTYTASFRNSNFSKEEKQNYKNDISIDEPALVEKLAEKLQLDSELVEVDYTNYIEKLAELIYYIEAGHGSPAIYPLDQVLVRAKQDVTVLLEGQGADEMLGGYIQITGPLNILRLLGKFQFGRALREINAFKRDYSLSVSLMLLVRYANFKIVNDLFLWFSGLSTLFVGPIKDYVQLKDYPTAEDGFDDSLNKHLFRAHTGGLVNLLHYGDGISMKNTLESRLPFMDYRLVEFVFSLPGEFKVSNGKGKVLHREAMKGIVPNFILENPLKFGFDSPLSEVLFSSGENSIKSFLLSEKAKSRGLFDSQKLEKMLTTKKTGSINYTRYLYRILCVEIWFQLFIDDPKNE